MKRKPKYLRKNPGPSKGTIVLLAIAAALLILVVCLILFIPGQTESRDALASGTSTEPSATAVNPPEMTTEAQTEFPAEETESTEPAPPQMLESMKSLYEENQDIIAWIRIEGTQIDYPVMYTPDDPEKYLHLNFVGNYDIGGLPFIDANCSMNPESDNLLIYGHNMKNGTMFRSLIGYEMKDFWQEHPLISLTTLYEEWDYEIVAAFYDRVYYTYEDCFKFYRFIDPADEAEFNEGLAYFKEHALYDTGVSAEYGDKLITLVTCAYHVDNGRFVVVAKEKS